MPFRLRWEVEVSMTQFYLLVDLKMSCYRKKHLVMYAVQLNVFNLL